MKRFSIVLASVALVVAACTPTPGGTPASGTPAASEGPTRGGTVIFAMWQEPTTLAPPYINQTIAGLVAYVAVEGLNRIDTDGNYQPVLAKAVPTISNGGVKLSADGKRMDVTYELLSGVTWSDGHPFTSADVKFTWENRLKDPKVVNRGGYDQIESIDTPSDTSLVLHFKSIYAPYPVLFGTGPALLAKHVAEKEADLSKSDYNQRPLGTGPFKITEFVAGDHITAERNPNYRFKDRPYLDKIIFKSVPASEVAIAQLKAGEVQGMWNILESQTPDLEKESAIKLVITPSPSVERIELNTAQNKDMTDPSSVHPVLGDIAVRKALLWATPKQQIVDKLLFGKAKPGTSGYSQGWAKYTGTQDGYDPKKANDELDKAGWVKGTDGIRAKGGVRASLTITTTTGNKTREQVEQVLVDEYKQIGVELRIQNQPSSVFLSGSWSAGDPRKRGTFDLDMYATSPDIDPHIHIFTRFHSSQIPSAANNGLGNNYTRLKSPEVDKAIDEGGATLDVEKRKAAYTRAINGINDSYALIWLYERASIDAFRANVGGWQGNVWDNITWNSGDWYLKK
ncbi:MAG TPA: peptide ABC transporter substrate-binding protein [Candidatus Limnocylindria bacterium]|nr:peptide ABC transporter substrate-binding protein [Candidatus Limnocylindria bacterium]